jgi:hypothetical protein
MSYSAVVGAAGLVIVSAFAIAEHQPRMKTNSEFRLTQSAAPDPAVDPNIADEKSTAVVGLPTAPEGE